MIAPAMSTLYSFTPVEVLTRLFSATVIGIESTPENTIPNRKSFQICVNCQIRHTMKIGSDTGSRIFVKIVKKPAPSMRAAFTSSAGMLT